MTGARSDPARPAATAGTVAAGASATTVVIVDAEDDHGGALAALIEKIFGDYPGVVFVPEELPELAHIATTFRGDGGQFWCAFRGARLVGCVGWTPAVDGPGIELKKLYVAADERRQRLGHRLATMVEDTARGRGARFVELWSDVRFTTAHRFYEARGYRRDGRTRALGDRSNTVEYHFRMAL